jgi:hypothetical protein
VTSWVGEDSGRMSVACVRGDGRQVTWLALAAEAGSVNKAQEVDRASAGRQLATWLTLLGNIFLSAIFSFLFGLKVSDYLYIPVASGCSRFRRPDGVLMSL